ncbi:MAG: thioredoxin domain-containing protein [Xanthomonadales bacterium]|jgi:uncharacterized protein YyaL (SSP411 family)|nr:thioredoxin domain-containing protein [Xanthomonadales bacterium]
MNRLGNETSLYLRQHADNPVHWQPWDDQALQEAREQDRPILLSIGYSACHWCHVMAHESFEDEATAELMNRFFVNVKVDREERPDLDRIYQLAQQMLSGRGGGWPLTVFLDPVDHVPFFAGTYFPKEPRYGMPAFGEVLQSVHGWFGKNRGDVSAQNRKVLDAIRSVQQPRRQGQEKPLEEAAQELVQAAAQQIYSRHDVVHGGYGGVPKFPQAPTLEAVAMLGRIESGNELHRSLEFTLEQMALSGLRDHLDGGFFRYCVDDSWTIPHFEKMLYDNAMLLPLYAEGARRWNNALLQSAAEGIADWLETEMRQASGAYAASIDADADGEEGGFHVWTREQVEAVLDDRQRAHFLAAYGMEDPPNFEMKSWHLQLARSGPDRPRQFPSWSEAREKLRVQRESRVHPALDDKRLTSWNALLAGGYTRAGRALGEEAWLDRAEGIFSFLQRELWTGDGLLAVYNDGTARFEAYIDDYAWLLDALLHYLQSRWDRAWLGFAIELADAMIARFEDPEHGGFYFSDAAVEVPMTRSMIFQDDATPAGNAIAVIALNRLGRLLGELRYTDAAERCSRRALPSMQESPGAHASFLIALQEAILPPAQLVISANNEKQGASLKQWVESNYRVDCYLIGPADPTLPGILGEYHSDKPVTAWLCRGMHCLPPAHSRQELEAMLS